MSPLDAVWHILNFLAPAVFVGLFTAAGAWLMRMRGAGWRRLATWSVAPAVLVSMAGLVFTGRDGTMLTYAAMVVAAAVGAWFGSGRARRT